MADTSLDIIKSSLRLVGRLGIGEELSGPDAIDALKYFNWMIESWSTERLNIFEVERFTFTLTVNDSTYTIGSGGDIDRARPLKIVRAGLVDTSQSTNFEYPMQILTLEQYAGIGIKSLQEDIPLYIYPDNAFPLMTLNIYPVPRTAHDVAIYSWNELSTLAALATELAFPPGYALAFVYNLAVLLGPQFGVVVPPGIIEAAKETKGNIKALNVRPIRTHMKNFLHGTGVPWDYRYGE